MFGVLEKRSFFQKGEFNVNDSVKNINNTLSLVLNPGGKEVNVVLSEPTLKLLSDYCNLKQFPIIKREKKNQNSNYDIAFEEIQDKVKQVVQNKNTKSLFEKGSNKEGILFENLLNELYKCFLEYDPDFQQSNDTSLKTLLELVSFDYISGIKDKFSINEINLEQLAEKISASQLLPLIVYRQPLNSDYNILKISARDQKYFKEKGIDVGERLRNVLSEARELVENKKYSENVDLGGGYEFPAILCLISLTSEEDFIKNIKNHESIIDLLKLPDDQNSDWGECFRDERGRTILHYLAYKNKTKVIESFISKLARENEQKVKELLTYQDNYGRTVYHAAAAANSKEALKSFLDYESVYFSSSDEKPSTKPDDYKRTPLHLAAMCDSVDTLKQLCYDSASSDWLFNAKDNYGRTPLHLAAMYNSIKALEYLINSGNGEDAFYVKDELGRTPFHLAAMHNSIDVLELMCNKSNDIKGLLSFRDSIKRTPFHLAAKYNSIDALELMCDNSNDIESSISSKDNYERTPFHLAAKYNSIGALELMCDKSNDIKGLLNVCDEHGRTAVHLAAANNRPEVVRKCIEAMNTEISELVDVTDRNGNTPFHLAAKFGSIDVLELLGYEYLYVEQVNKQNKHGSTALHHAAYGKHLKAIDVLIESGADLSMEDKDKCCPLIVAAKFNKKTKKDFDLNASNVIISKLINHDYSMFVSPLGKFSYALISGILEEQSSYLNEKCKSFVESLYTFLESNPSVFKPLKADKQDSIPLVTKAVNASNKEIIQKIMDDFPELLILSDFQQKKLEESITGNSLYKSKDSVLTELYNKLGFDKKSDILKKQCELFQMNEDGNTKVLDLITEENYKDLSFSLVEAGILDESCIYKNTLKVLRDVVLFTCSDDFKSIPNYKEQAKNIYILASHHLFINGDLDTEVFLAGSEILGVGL